MNIGTQGSGVYCTGIIRVDVIVAISQTRKSVKPKKYLISLPKLVCLARQFHLGVPSVVATGVKSMTPLSV